MPKSERNLDEREEAEKRKEEIKRIARVTKFWLSIVIAFLSIILLILIFRIGEDYWVLWLVDYRKQGIGAVLLLLTVVLLLSPVIIEVNSNTRTLNGPGHDPKFGPFFTKKVNFQDGSCFSIL
ncbi:MAG TPA: hypothetical protein PKL78_07105 [Anaerolineales bacterium]|nr:hypothetical protein [Anaerolineales bacterium]HNN13306.1 hypothetical protein [Anaerolineales bacterium]